MFVYSLFKIDIIILYFKQSFVQEFYRISTSMQSYYWINFYVVHFWPNGAKNCDIPSK